MRQKERVNGVRRLSEAVMETEVFYAGTVTPVLHYCTEGITIDTMGNVIDENGKIIPGLHAAGEVTGGVHGNNRPGGNCLLECTVHGTIVGKELPIRTNAVPSSQPSPPTVAEQKVLRDVTMEELQNHNTLDDFWTAISGIVCNLTSFIRRGASRRRSLHP